MAMGWQGYLGWSVIGGGAIAAGGFLGAALGSIGYTTSTTLSVVTGMGAILGLSWGANQFMKWVAQHRPQQWGTTAIRVGFVRGAINFSVAIVLLLITLWRVLWPAQDWPLSSLGLGVGLLAALVGGMIAASVIARSQAME